MDFARIHSGLGKIHFKKAYQSKSYQEFYNHLLESEKNYKLATQFCPIDDESALGLAYATASLEEAYSKLNPNSKKNRYNAMPLYERAISLRPNGITVNYAMLKYLFKSSRIDLIPYYIKKVAFVYPSAWSVLKKEPFYKEEYNAFIKEGLNQAIQNNRSLRLAHSVLSSIYENEGDFTNAIKEYRIALKERSHVNNSESYINLGRCYLKNNDKEAAFIQFVKAMTISKKRKDHIKSIYYLFKQEGRSGYFIELLEQINQKNFTDEALDLYEARAWIDLNNQGRAKSILNFLNLKEPIAESYYLLATVNQKEKDWDAMELNSQRATVLDQSNSRYLSYFILSLNYQKKYLQAEEVITKIIMASKKINPWNYNQRAWIRWSRQNFDGAIIDWEEAIKLKPRNHYFYYCISLAYKKR